MLYANAVDYVSSSEEIDISTLLMALAGAFGEQLEAAGGAGLAESFWDRVRNYLTRTTLQASEVTAKAEGSTPGKELIGELKGGLELKLALKTAPSFRQKLQEFLANRLGELKREVNAFVEEGVKAVRKARNNPELPVVFLFDQFEQLRGSRITEQAVIQSVERVFTNHLELLRLPYVHAVYTVPPWLQFVRPGAFSIETLPCVRLWNNNPKRTKYKEGWDLLWDALERRFGADGLKHVFGSAPQNRSELGAKLIGMSGGHFRDLLRLFQETITLILTWRPKLPVEPEVVERAILNVRNEYLPIALEDARWLAQIEVERKTALPDSTPESVGRLSRFLDTHLVLYLTNGEDWYNVHPLIRDEVCALTKPPPPNT